jgi:alpha-amylase
VWEPGLPAPLAEAGVEWTLVDDAHFRMVGLRDDELDGHFITEDQGRRIKLFAGSQRLRYTIPWADVEDVIVELRAIASSGARDDAYVVLGDDGEKFGGWPTTHAHVWEKGWIERFFSAVERERDWLVPITPGAYAKQFRAHGLVYLPTASYAEMMEWAMPPAAATEYRRVTDQARERGETDALAYLRAGFWRYFLARYPEANAMHKRGLRIAEKLAGVDAPEARDALWAAQCNCSYWHGVFGGLYLRHIRTATLTNLVRAERLADEATGTRGVRVQRGDLDYDGKDEVLVQTGDLSLMVHPELGGMVSELDLRKRDWPLLSVLPRRREAYHDALLAGTAHDASEDVTNIHGAVRLKERGLAEGLVFDRYRRGALQEWILAADATVDAFARGEVTAQLEPDGAWDVATHDVEGGVLVRLERQADGWHVAKQIELPAAGERLTVRYELRNDGSDAREGIALSEWNVSPPQAPGGDDRTARIETARGAAALHEESGLFEDVDSFTVTGSAACAVRAELDGANEVWHFPVITVSSSEGGLERVAQGASVSVARRFALDPGASVRFGMTFSVVAVAD